MAANPTPPHFTPTQCQNVSLLAHPHSIASLPSSSPFPPNLSHSLAVPYSKPNPKRAERYPHYHSCSRQWKVCLDLAFFLFPLSRRRPALVRILAASNEVGESRGASHPAVVLYEFQALYTLISGIRVVCRDGNIGRTRCVLSPLCGLIQEHWRSISGLQASGKALSLSRHPS